MPRPVALLLASLIATALFVTASWGGTAHASLAIGGLAGEVETQHATPRSPTAPVHAAPVYALAPAPRLHAPAAAVPSLATLEASASDDDDEPDEPTSRPVGARAPPRG